MAMLDRYSKKGGFIQLLKLIEGCAPKKQEQLLTLVEKESTVWFNVITSRLLTLEKIFSWNDEALAEIVGRVQHLTLALIMFGLTDDQWERLSRTLSFSQKRHITDLKDIQKPTPAEVMSAEIKFIEEIRQMFVQGILRFEKVDPNLIIPHDIEEQIRAGNFGDLISSSHSSMHSSAQPSALDGPPPVAPSQPGMHHPIPVVHAQPVLEVKPSIGVGEKEELDAAKKEILLLRAQIFSMQNEIASLKERLKKKD